MRKLILLIVALLSLQEGADAQLTTRVIRDSLFIPWELQYGPDNRIWFTQKNGYICRLDPASAVIDTLYYEPNTYIQGSTGEGGMLGMVLHPDFPNTPFIYVAYNYLQGSGYKERIVKYQYNAVTDTLMSAQTILDNINGATYHNGCRLVMVGNYLYISTGDATVSSVAQDNNSVNGKILRLLQDGSVPSDNPIQGNPLWSKGHRNAQGLVYANGRLYESEHGPNNDDEVNIIQKGSNYGWPNVEGYCNLPAEVTFCNDSNVSEPLMAWTPTLAVCGIDYYDHPMFPLFRKSLIMTTLKDSKLYRLKLNANLDDIDSVIVISGVSFGRLRDICISPEGRIYLSTSNSQSGGAGNRIDKIIEIYDPSYNTIPAYTKNGEAVRIYPNPATNEVYISVNQYMFGAGIVYSISDISGKILQTGSLNYYQNLLNIANLSKGIYILHVTDNKGLNVSKRVSKQ